jgi:two-component system, oxyanion-binding sensor
VRATFAERNADVLARLLRAHRRAAAFVEEPANREEVTALLAAPHRLGVDTDVIRRSLDGKLKIAPDGSMRVSDRYMLIGRNGASRPDPVQAAWLYAQMVRFGQAPLSPEMLAAAKAVFRPDLFDGALAAEPADLTGEPVDGIGAFAGPAFNADDIAGYLATWLAGVKR